MAELITREELEAHIEELRKLLAVFPPKSRMCEKCHLFYDAGSRDRCYCDYESTDF